MRVYKSMFDKKWVAKSIVPFVDDKRIVIETKKDTRGGVSTFANVVTVKNGVETWMPFSDYGAYVELDRTIKATEKNIINQHNKALTFLPQFETNAKKHYQIAV